MTQYHPGYKPPVMIKTFVALSLALTLATCGDRDTAGKGRSKTEDPGEKKTISRLFEGWTRMQPRAGPLCLPLLWSRSNP